MGSGKDDAPAEKTNNTINQEIIETEITPPDYFIQKKIGETAAHLIGNEEVQRAGNFLNTMNGTILANVIPILNDIISLSGNKKYKSAKTLLQKAQEVYDIANDEGLKKLAKLCGLLCIYLDNKNPDFIPNIDLVVDIATAAKFAMKSGIDKDAIFTALIKEAETAVMVQMKRENREFDN